MTQHSYGRWVGRGLAAAVGAAIVLASLGAAPSRAATTAVATDSGLITQLIVQYEPGVAPSEAPGVATGDAAVTSATLETGDAIGFGLRTVTLGHPADEATAQTIADQLRQSPGVAYAQPDRVVTLDTVQPTAPWGLDRIDQTNLPLDGTYQYQTSGAGAFDSTGSGVTAYVIDTGIRSTHTDFGGRVAAGYSGIADGRGTEDCNGHGTHVSGTIGGSTYGVAKSVTLVPVRVFGCTGSTTVSAIIAGINWVVADHTTGPAVANMSLSSTSDTLMDAAVNTLINDGVTVAVAAGNDSVSSCTRSPAEVPNAITVNASTNADAAASFSDFGSCSDLYAPGLNITSDWITNDTATNTISGTSMASPHVAGAAARLLGKDNTLTPAQVWNAVSLAASNIAFAPGSGDPDKLLYVNPGALVTRPDAPRSVNVTAGNTTAAVSWLTPTSNGGDPISSYTATAWDAAANGTSRGTCTPTPATGLSCTITGLLNGSTYYLDVAATNTIGAGSPSARVSATLASVATVPGQPRSVAATAANASAAVSWLGPASDGGSAIDSYTAQAWTAPSGGSLAGSCTPAPATGLTCTISALTNGTTHYVDVLAHNAQGNGAPSSPRVSVVPALVPTAPQSVAATAGNGSAAVTWLAPSSNGGSALTSYTARAWTGATDGSLVSSCQPSPLTSLGCTITGLTNSTPYYVDVVAANIVGTGAAPAARVTVTPTAPPAGGGGSSGGSSGSSSGGGGGGGSATEVTEVRPSSGPTSGGARILVLGFGFWGATGVTIGGVPATDFRFIDAATLEVTTPPGTAGWQPLAVVMPGGQISASYLYVAASASSGSGTGAGTTPATGPTAPAVAPTAYVGPASSAVVRPAAATVALTSVTTFGKPLSRTTSSAPRFTSSAGGVLRLGLSRLPRSTVMKVQLLVSGRYYPLGSVTTTARGSVVLPAFQTNKAGTYLVRLTAPGGSHYYLKVLIR